MRLISHRGNIAGPEPVSENTTKQIDKALYAKYDVEVDIHYCNKKIYLGHDSPENVIDLQWLLDRKNSLWVHCKNIYALDLLHDTDINYFWHQEDDFTLTSKKNIWTYPGKQLISKSICVLPERGYNGDLSKCAGICSDYILNYTTYL